MRFRALVCGLAIAATAPAAAAQENYTQTRVLSLFNQLMDVGACESALPEARQLWRSREFREQLVIEDQQNFLGAVVQCAITLQDMDEAIEASNAGHDRRAPWADRARLELALSTENHGLSVEAFFDLARSDPKDFATMESYNAWGALRAAERIDGGEDTMLRMHEALRAANYAPREDFHDDFFRLAHARLLLERGRVDEARERMRGVLDPWAVLMVRINSLYDPLRGDADFERSLDIVASADAAVARARVAIAENPRQLGPVMQLSALLRYMGRSEEALALVDPVVSRALSADAAAHYDDLDAQLNWIVFTKADLLYDLGRNEEARTIYSEAMSANGVGSANITIMFAGMLNAEGRAADALQILSMLWPLPPSAEVWHQAERACAAHQVGDVAARDAALAIVQRDERLDMSSASHAYLCVGNIDAAAALMVRRLNDRVEREGALVALQLFQRMETRQMPMEVIELQRVAEVRDRPEVRAAAAAVGRIEQTPIYAY